MKSSVVRSSNKTFLKENFVKVKLRAGKPAVGTWVEMPFPDIAEQLSPMGFDWLVFDVEHGVYSFPQVQAMMQGMNNSNTCLPMVRVPINEPVYFKWALDTGARGIVIPMVNSKEEAERAVKSCKYPPEGFRGCGPRRAALYGAATREYVERANDDVLVVTMIETEKAIQNIDSILSVKGIDAIFVGPDDLSLNLGIFQQRENRKFARALESILEACRTHGVAPGMHCNENNISSAISQGFQFVALNDDDTFLQLGAQNCLARVKGWESGPAW
ncbi:MAG TPA: aldolase/citrate lyase family protein [Nitrososphaerales archaeon]|nr:aldolase/citrate lyase family protein [Nitrososphaerales archaeon]